MTTTYKEALEKYKSTKRQLSVMLPITATDIALSIIAGKRVNSFITSYTSIICLNLYTNYKNILNSQEYTKLTKDYQQIRRIILENSRDLDLHEIIEIYAYFRFLVENNYLSACNYLKDQEESKIYHRKDIAGQLVFNNHGLADSYAYLLEDILDSRIPLAKALKMRPVKTVESPLDLDTNVPIAYSLDTIKELPLKDRLDMLCKYKEYLVYAQDEDITYYLNPIKTEIFRPLDTSKYLESINGNIVKLKSRNKDKHLTKETHYNILNDQNALKEIKNTQEYIGSKEKLLEDFYASIKPLLEDCEENYQKIISR